MSWVTRSLATVMLVGIGPATAAAQDFVIAGTVRTSAGEPARGAIVSVETLNLATLTNDDGFYRLVVPTACATGTIKLQAQTIGYRQTAVPVTLTAGAQLRQDITLLAQPIALADVVATGTAGALDPRAQDSSSETSEPTATASPAAAASPKRPDSPCR